MANKFFESVYKYTDPVRYFKANDPYYYEVDNIPLKQLQENCNFLKDQIGKVVDLTDTQLGRDNFTELKPFVYGIDNVVYVNPGRYTARVNDAYSITPLQILRQVGGFGNSGDSNQYQWATTTNAELNSILQKFRSNLAADALGANGMFERAFTYFTRDIDQISQYAASGSTTTPGTTWSFLTKVWPNVFGLQVPYNAYSTSSLSSTVFSTDFQIGLGNLFDFESNFIKRWRGVTRTAIVDVPDTLSIEVPGFTSTDFFYKDSLGQTISTAGSTSQRIDLLFIYSKPIDTSAVTISKFVNNQPVKINRPTLGLLKGAGIGINLTTSPTTPQGAGVSPTGQIGRLSSYSKLTDANGDPIMLPSLGDANNSDMGFSGVKGSFPAPDDLLNISPLLAEQLETNNISLIGQSILPIAYIVVKQTAGTNSQNAPIITSEDVIDIRPFFRTTELAYNERAGIAAALPQISIANPVASEGYVDSVANKIDQKIIQVRSLIPPGLAGDPRILWSGYIKGGLNAGPESVLLDYLRKNSFTNSTTEQEAQTTLRNIFNYPEGTILRGSPDWDLAAWAQRLPTSQIQSYGAGGSHINDWINFTYSRYENTPGPTTNSNLTKYGFGTESAAANTPVSTEGRMINSYPSKYTTNNGGYYSMPFVKKTFTVIKPTWAQDVRVDARLFNCCPLSFAGTSFHDAAARAPAAKIANIWTSKKTLNSTSIEITIFVSWAIDLSTPDNNGNGVKLPSMNRNQLGLYNGFAVITPDMVAESDQDMEGVFYGTTQSSWTGTYERGSTLGVCVYPTVQFDIIGVPAGRGANVDYFYQSNTTINLTQA